MTVRNAPRRDRALPSIDPIDPIDSAESAASTDSVESIASVESAASDDSDASSAFGGAADLPLAVLYVTRKKGYAEPSRRYALLVDDHRVAYLREGESARIAVEPGLRRVALASGKCVSNAFTFRAAPGEDVYLSCGNFLRSRDPFRTLWTRTFRRHWFLHVVKDDSVRSRSLPFPSEEQSIAVPCGLDAALSLMHGFQLPWCVAGGWALDLFLGHPTRPHADVEIAIFRDDQGAIKAHLAGWQFFKMVGGKRRYWTNDEPPLALPVHEIHAESAGHPPRGLEVLLNERKGKHWVFRRKKSVRRRMEHVIVKTAHGVPILAPEIVLLYKAKDPREKDEADFEAARGALGGERREWLRLALEDAHPEHAWLKQL